MLEPTVIGGGMIANEFRNVKFRKKVIIFASGVSNSREVRDEEFARERRLIKSTMDESGDSLFVYFSSTSVFFGDETAYSKHKKEMEKLVRSYSFGFHIFRLPQVVGVVNNNTLISYFAKSCFYGDVLNIKLSAKRNLIGVSDLSRVVCQLVNAGYGLNTAQVIASGSNVFVPDIVKEISAIVGRSPNIRNYEGGDDQSVSIKFLRTVLDSEDPLLQPGYWKHVLRQYVPHLVEGFCE